MKAQVLGFGFIFILFVLLVDLYSYRGINRLALNLNSTWTIIVNIAFFALTAVALFLIIRMVVMSGKIEYQRLMNIMKKSMGYLILIYVPKLFFILFLLVRDLIVMFSVLISRFRIAGSPDGNDLIISRADFILRLGLIVAVIPFLSIIYGIWKGKYNYRISRIKLKFKNLPAEFDGLKIAQISDLHLGSFEDDSSRISPAIDLVNDENPDVVVFTGDLVNNLASEARPFTGELARLQAKESKLSILGNHDYGTYYQWGSEKELRENMEELYGHHKASGFRLLRNEVFHLDRNGKRVSILGVENWGEPPFPQYGDLQKVLACSEGSDFRILLSHDPSHWDAQVRPGSDIELTLSGHTHGMQFAINIPGWKWSPVKFKYPRWSGLYREGDQYLYVNIGLGFIAFPGRVGTPPEISIFELRKDEGDGDTSGNI